MNAVSEAMFSAYNLLYASVIKTLFNFFAICNSFYLKVRRYRRKTCCAKSVIFVQNACKLAYEHMKVLKFMLGSLMLAIQGKREEGIVPQNEISASTPAY